MNHPFFFNSKNSLNLFGLQKNFDFISKLYLKKKLPKILMLTGPKGSGKSTLVNHFLYSVFDKDNYDINNFLLKTSTHFYKQFKDDFFSNIIYLKGSDFKSIKIEDIRNLRTRIFQSTILDKDRFIVLDDIELFNHNSLNALLKIIEEPTKNNYFFLINNKSKPLLDTIKSRSVEIKIALNENQRLKIIDSLINNFKIKLVLDPKSSQLSPGNFVRFNHLCSEYNISPSTDFVENLSILLDLFKKNKDILFINLAFFIFEHYFKRFSERGSFNKNKIYEIKNEIFDILNNFKLYNINHTALLNAVSSKLNYE
jgi:DNA polymerase-3 subunit delta'